MNKLLYISYFISTMLALAACKKEDDIDQIFSGKTWYMNGATIKGKHLNSEVSNFYTDAGEGAYYIRFSSNTFSGELSDGDTFNGTWSADGRDQTINLTFATQPAAGTPFDQQLRTILISPHHSYSSGASFLQLKKDGSNSIYFGDSRGSHVFN